MAQIDIEPDVPPEDEAPVFEMPPGLEWLYEPPPSWFHWTQWTLRCFAALLFGGGVIYQWGLWMILTSNILRPWGMAIGVIIAAAQILALSEHHKLKGQSC